MAHHIDFDLVTTRTGDGGKTSDFSGTVGWKDSPVFELLGDVDELNSWLGVLKHLGPQKSAIEKVQTTLLHLGSRIATDPASPLAAQLKPVGEHEVDELERWEKNLFDGGVKIRPQFVLPGASPRSAQADVARTVCRRAERKMVAFVRDGRPDLAPGARFLNRLSDVLFVLARSWDEGR
jgi:cob(I)alamin adenosyltransferase